MKYLKIHLVDKRNTKTIGLMFIDWSEFLVEKIHNGLDDILSDIS
jgi:hypothetical protein